MKFTISVFCLLACMATSAYSANYPESDAIESIPEPPLGQRWVLNETFSDEFNGDKLDTSKWYDYHPNWIGREPGIFLPSQVSLKDGNMVFTAAEMDKDTTVTVNKTKYTFNIRCAAVVSKTRAAHYGYYECRFKANKTPLSTTFWLSSAGASYSTEGRQPDGADEGKFAQELDICECVGRSTTKLYDGMNSNIHYWFTPTGGSKQDIKPKMKLLERPDGGKPADDFNIYGCWWRDAEEATFYLNNAQGYSVDFENEDNGDPFRFTEPMHLNMVMETYSWVEDPTSEELNNSNKNKSYYDWVRSYVLEDADKEVAGASETEMFDEHVHFNSKPKNIESEMGKLTFHLGYTANTTREVEIAIYDKQDVCVASQTITVYGGYANANFQIGALSLVDGESYTAVAHIRPEGAEGNVGAYEGDSFTFKAEVLQATLKVILL